MGSCLTNTRPLSGSRASSHRSPVGTEVNLPGPNRHAELLRDRACGLSAEPGTSHGAMKRASTTGVARPSSLPRAACGRGSFAAGPSRRPFPTPHIVARVDLGRMVNGVQPGRSGCMISQAIRSTSPRKRRKPRAELVPLSCRYLIAPSPLAFAQSIDLAAPIALASSLESLRISAAGQCSEQRDQCNETHSHNSPRASERGEEARRGR